MGRRRSGQPVHGWVVLDKPYGMSSSRAVSAVQRAFDAMKAGHGGTLDPLATGVLPIALGEATKTVAWAMDGRKTYGFTLRWGEARSTDDLEGEIVATSPVRPSIEELRAVLPRFIGTVLQKPPPYSALKLDGQRAYALARQGESVDLAPREVTIESLAFVAAPDADHAAFEAVVGKGTYIRSLARDLGEAVGSCAHVTALRRLAVGRFTAEAAISLEKLEGLSHIELASKHLLPVETALDDIPALALTEAEAHRLRRGQAVAPLCSDHPARIDQFGNGTVLLAISGNTPVALARIVSGELRPVRVLNL